MNKWLECGGCGKSFPLKTTSFICPDCLQNGSTYALEAQYDYDAMTPEAGKRLVQPQRSMWGYRELLPVEEGAEPVTLGEGMTPLSPLQALRRIGYASVWYKNESVNPTWSHKDRFNSVAMTQARELGFAGTTCSSTGNHGLSGAAYAARAGLKSVIFFPPETPKVMVDLASHYGAMAVITQWHSREEMVKHLCRQGWYPGTSLKNNPLTSPFGVEGYKTIAYEIVADLGRVPDLMLVPVAGGNALYGIFKGFRELARLGLTEKVPKMIACQAAGANALQRSFEAGRTEVGVQPRAFSLATSTREETSGDNALHALYASGGSAVSVSDLAIQEAMTLVAREGFCVEAASAIPIACLLKLIREGAADPAQTIVCLLTSGGVKSPDILADMRRPAVRIEGSTDALDEAMKTVFVAMNPTNGEELTREQETL